MAIDIFSSYASALDSPAANAAAVTPSNTTDLPYVSRSLYVGGAGNVVVDTLGGQTSVTFSGVPAGTTLAIRATRVYATGTTATFILNLW